MIIDTLERFACYFPLHGAFVRAHEFLSRPDLATLPDGKVAIDGENLYASVARGQGKRREDARLEAHRRYIDIQLVLAGRDDMGWRDIRDCRAAGSGYNEAKDIVFYEDRPVCWMTVQAGSLAVFFPHDGHAPLVSDGPIHKVVVKVAIQEGLS